MEAYNQKQFLVEIIPPFVLFLNLEKAIYLWRHNGTVLELDVANKKQIL